MQNTLILLGLLWAMLGVTTTNAQQWGGEVNGQVGYNIPIHPHYPSIGPPSYTAEVALLHRPKKRIWYALYGQPTVAFTAAYQTLGNQQVLGEAFYLVPSLDFNLFKAGRFSLQGRVGWGAGITTKKYDSFTNPSNIVIGSHINACVSLRARARYRLGKAWHLLLGGGITHYSNGRFTLPNLGVNIPFGQIGVQYLLPSKISTDSLRQQLTKDLPTLNQSFRPFLTIGLGFTEVETSRGPKYPIYRFTVGVSRMMARISKLSVEFEYMYNNAVLAFDQHVGTVPYRHFNYARLSFLVTHELLFGHWGFLTSVGAYLNNHRYRRSPIVTKIGFNFYLHNYFKHIPHQLWVGCHVRAYAGEAELVEFVLGYNW